MPEAVIVAAARSPIGRARKGSLRDLRADDMAAQMVTAALDRVPELDRAEVEDLILGCGAPGGEQGGNLGRVVAVLAGLPSVPGTTITRFCSSSLQSTRMAFHAIRAGEGDVFVSAGVESASRLDRGASDEDTRNPAFRSAWERSARRAEGDAPVWTDPAEEGELPDVYIAMGQTAENVAQLRGVSRQAQDEYAVRSQQLTEKSQASGFWDREISPLVLPDGIRVTRDDSPRAGTTLEAVSQLNPVFRPDGTVTAGNACPLNDGAAALVVMSDTRAAELGLSLDLYQPFRDLDGVEEDVFRDGLRRLEAKLDVARELGIPAVVGCGTATEVVGDGRTGLTLAMHGGFDLVVLDLGLPGLDGLEVCRRLRTFSDAYVIMLTARAEEVDTLIGLSVGADDYMAKPFSPRELLARIKAVLRRQAPVVPGAPGTEDESVTFGEYELSLATRELKKGDEVHMLTTGEFAVLKALVQHAREPLTRDKLMNLARGREWDALERSIDVQISRLRRLIEPDPSKPRYIQTVWGVGYVFVPDGKK